LEFLTFLGGQCEDSQKRLQIQENAVATRQITFWPNTKIGMRALQERREGSCISVHCLNWWERPSTESHVEKERCAANIATVMLSQSRNHTAKNNFPGKGFNRLFAQQHDVFASKILELL